MIDLDDELADLRAEDRSQRRYRSQLVAAPDCQDPEHPGCECCCGDEADEVGDL